MPTASSMSATSPRRSARRRAAITIPRTPSPTTASDGSRCRSRSSACCSPTAPHGSPRKASRPTSFPTTWEEYRAVGKKLKAKSRPLGQTLAHAFGDGPAFWYPYLWSWGGKEVEADGKTVVLNSKETIELVKFAVGFWKDAFDEGGMSWDDAGNNRAFLANTISSTSNGASIYLLARSKPDTYMTETGKPLKDDMLPLAAAQRPGRPVQLSRAVLEPRPDLRQEPEGGEGLPALVPLQGGLRHLVHLAAGLLGGRDQGCGKTTSCGTTTR